MMAGRIERATRVLTAPPEIPPRTIPFNTLAIRDEKIAGFPAMASAWFPTAEEVARMVLGAPIYLHLVATEHPPVTLEVGRVPTPEPA